MEKWINMFKPKAETYLVDACLPVVHIINTIWVFELLWLEGFEFIWQFTQVRNKEVKWWQFDFLDEKKDGTEKSWHLLTFKQIKNVKHNK